MKKYLSLVLIISLLLVGCGSSAVQQETAEGIEEIAQSVESETQQEELEDPEIAFNSLSDNSLLQYVEDEVYEELETSFASDDYVVEDVSAIYLSKEYIEELSYNSQSNIYFGYTLEELDAQFDGEKYLFTCDDSGQTIVTSYENYDDTYDQVLENVMIGTGVIIVCVTLSVATGGAGMPAVSAVFMASAKTGTAFALSSGVISGAMTAVVTGIETKDVDATVKAAALQASKDFKWGAIIGAASGGISELVTLQKASKASNAIPTPRESEQYVAKLYGGNEQVAYSKGEQVAYNAKGCTKPDVVVENANGTLDAIEVKNYDLSTSQNRSGLISKLKKQISQRVNDLPEGSTQRIVLDTRNRGYSKELIDTTTNEIESALADIYPNIPIEVLE